MKLNAKIENIVFRNNENGYSVLDLDATGELITAVGIFPPISVGEDVSLIGDYIVNKQYGKQFKVTSVKISSPTDLNGIKKYLGSGVLKGVGAVIAERIVGTFGKDTFNILEFNPKRLTEVKGISMKKAEEIGICYDDVKKMKEAVMFLQGYEIGLNLALKIYDAFKGHTEEIVKENPYKLVEKIDGVGFLTADKIALNLGFKPNSEFRMRACLLHNLKESAERHGNTYLPKDELKQKCFELLCGYYQDSFESAINSMKLDNLIKTFDNNDFACVMLSNFYYAEQNIAGKLVKLNENKNKNFKYNEEEIETFEKKNKIKFHETQKVAIKQAIENGVVVITGGPGTGKTTIVKGILSILKSAKQSVLCLAPTGRAAKRLSEATGEDAKTIHRGLEFRQENGGGFFYGEQEKLPYDAVICDEVSMIDSVLFNSLTKALRPETKLILVGDKNQLPSVGAGNVLADVITSSIIPVVNLTQVYRQSETSCIVLNAYEVNLGNVPSLKNESSDFFFESKETGEDIANSVLGLVASRLPKFLKTTPSEIQVLCSMKNGLAGVDNLNEQLQKILNPYKKHKPEIKLETRIFREGDKVMHIVNNYELEWKRVDEFGEFFGQGVFNGDIGKVIHIPEEMDTLSVEFDDGRVAVYQRARLNELTHAYAITVHKSQGSEFDYVVIPVVAGSPTILTKNLLYTAITRAKKFVVLVGTKTNISRMVKNNYVAKRFSYLREFLIAKQKEYDNMFS